MIWTTNFSVLFLSFLSMSIAGTFDWTFANLTIWHSENTYCDPDTYLTRTNKGPLEEFIATYGIDDPSHDTHGYIGYTTSQMAIYVAYRGSETPLNFVDDFHIDLVDYPGCDQCKVHKGFYHAELSVIVGVIEEVLTLWRKYPSFKIILTGHSLGAALATLTAFDLIEAGIPANTVRLFTYGSPRIGNNKFGEFASALLTDHFRVTHHKDMMVHFPTHLRYMHMDNEWYQPGDDVFVVGCSGYEDPNCSYQWLVDSVRDHLYYIGVHLGVGECAALLE